MDNQQRWFLFWLWLLSSFWVLSSLLACSGVSPSARHFSAPFLVPTVEDATRIATLTHELDTKALHCLEVANCEQVYFARALVSLFENREVARESFHLVILHNPSSPLAMSSRHWLRWIENDENAVTSIDMPAGPSTYIVTQFVRDWMERQLAEEPNSQRAATPTSIQDAGQSRVIQMLQRQVRDRDRQIAVLRSQLEALKLIDEDHQQRTRSIKIPASFERMDNHP